MRSVRPADRERHCRSQLSRKAHVPVGAHVPELDRVCTGGLRRPQSLVEADRPAVQAVGPVVYGQLVLDDRPGGTARPRSGWRSARSSPRSRDAAPGSRRGRRNPGRRRRPGRRGREPAPTGRSRRRTAPPPAARRRPGRTARRCARRPAGRTRCAPRSSASRTAWPVPAPPCRSGSHHRAGRAGTLADAGQDLGQRGPGVLMGDPAQLVTGPRRVHDRCRRRRGRPSPGRWVADGAAR